MAEKKFPQDFEAYDRLKLASDTDVLLIYQGDDGKVKAITVYDLIQITSNVDNSSLQSVINNSNVLRGNPKIFNIISNDELSDPNDSDFIGNVTYMLGGHNHLAIYVNANNPFNPTNPNDPVRLVGGNSFFLGDTKTELFTYRGVVGGGPQTVNTKKFDFGFISENIDPSLPYSEINFADQSGTIYPAPEYQVGVEYKTGKKIDGKDVYNLFHTQSYIHNFEQVEQYMFRLDTINLADAYFFDENFYILNAYINIHTNQPSVIHSSTYKFFKNNLNTSQPTISFYIYDPHLPDSYFNPSIGVPSSNLLDIITDTEIFLAYTKS